DLLLGGPGDLAQLALHLTEVLTRADLLAGGSSGRGTALVAVGRARLGLVGALFRHHALRLSVHRHGVAVLGMLVIKSSFAAGQEGLEPPTAGFGDRCSTN